MDKVKGCCMACGQLFSGATRALVEGQFTWHIEEKHKAKLNNMQSLTVKFYDDIPPALPKRKVRTRESVAKKVQREIDAFAVWV